MTEEKISAIMWLKINDNFSRIFWRCDDDDDDDDYNDDDDDGDDDYADDDFSRGWLELLGGVALMSGGAALLCVGGEDPTLFTGLLGAALQCYSLL